MKVISKSILERFEHFQFQSNFFLCWLKLEIHPKATKLNFSCKIQKYMKVCGQTSIFQVCRVHFLVFWGPGKYGIKRNWGWHTPTPTLPPPCVDSVLPFIVFSFFWREVEMRWHCVVITKLLDLNFTASKLGGRWTMDLLLPEREQCWSWKEWTADVLQAFVVTRYLSAVAFKRVWTASSRWYFIIC